jgi:osmotically-inducible protein OsmY
VPASTASTNEAASTESKKAVKDRIDVTPEIPDNKELKKRVTTALFRDPYVERYEVTVTVSNGWVHLSGDVNTSFEKIRAERVTNRVKGVLGVVNDIDYEYIWFWKPDREIRANVKKQLESSASVEQDDISVSVEDGIVTLTGTVDSWNEKNEVEKRAYQGGAKDVKNYLMVDYRIYVPYRPGPAYYRRSYYNTPHYEPYEEPSDSKSENDSVPVEVEAPPRRFDFMWSR